MSDFFQVELDTLGTFISTLKDAEQHLTGLPKLLSGGDGNLGNDKLDDAAAHFQKSWVYGAGQLATVVSETTDAVSDVAQAYQSADSAVHTAFSEVTGVLGDLGSGIEPLLKKAGVGQPLVAVDR